MPKWLKVVLIVLAISFVICGGAVGACMVLAKKAGDSMQEFAQTGEAGKQYGQTHTGKECLDEALNKSKSCGDLKSISGVGCITSTTLFFQGCAAETKDKTALCENMPKAGEKGEAWAKARCAEAGMPGEACEAIYGQVPLQCVGAAMGGQQGEETPPTDEAPPAEEPMKEDKPE